MRMLVGAVLLLAAFRLLAPQRAAWLGKPAAWFWRRLQPLRDRGLARAGAAKPVVLGLFWGWLPCGLSTTLLAAAWLQASALQGALLMLAFGLGTAAADAVAVVERRAPGRPPGAARRCDTAPPR
jgi:sulfite exporter TauE/SafE